MTDPADRFLEEKLHALARGVSVPLVPTDDDVRRGRRRLFRMRVAMAGATTGRPGRRARRHQPHRR